ncbi:hypothetical protein [Paremcibacter congregatus]|uniref:Uncharacterized protein n=1 Tax=Paremcibacter congregatus TaxID=2043170 RepID=A0A2G4YTJ5_9PROT|nr:hypothetical protein [Paremcibacter congregatus]PHZ84766.1 hypothetical protein CRD36_10810 [Paremcibacter congregatus]QDE28958.1 hypothetical protein FIV45_17575 [Paremcibacter congregatus]
MHQLTIAITFFGCLFFTDYSISETENSQFFVFVGEKIHLSRDASPEGALSFDEQFSAKYKIIKPYKGSYSGTEIEFTVFDHYGIPAFSKYKYVLLYVVLHEGKYYHSKYMFSPLYKTSTGKWAGPYDVSAYAHSFNKNTNIKPKVIDFSAPVEIDISDMGEAQVERWYPKPYYKIKGNKALAVYGNYIDELFLLKQNGVLKAREQFQEYDFRSDNRE